MTASSWPALFGHPLFRKGWTDHIARQPWTEDQADSVVYIFGRMMAAESRRPLPRYSTTMTPEMAEIIRKCPAFERQMLTSQWLQAHGDPAKMDEALGIKQGG